jgi:Glycosyltransferase family 87
MRLWLTATLTLCILLVCANTYYEKTIESRLPILNPAPSDFLPYHQAAQHIVHGESPFLADGYIYPPLLAFLLTPLGPLDYVTARRIWFAISQLLLIASAVLLWRRFGRDWASACCIAIVWSLGGAAAESLALGQVTPLLTFLIVVAGTCRKWQRGAAVAFGFALKLFPGLLGVTVLLRGERKAIRAMILTSAAALLIPYAAVACFLRGPAFGRSSAWTGTPAALSWSLPSVVMRFLDPSSRNYIVPRNWLLGTDLEHFHVPTPLAIAGLAVSILTLAAGLFALVRCAGFRLREEQVPWAMSALVALALTASPISWTHYQVLQYPGVALLLIYAWRERRWLELIAALVVATLIYPLPIHLMDGFLAHLSDSFGALYFWTTEPALASIALFAMFVRRAARAVPPHEPPLHWPTPASYTRLPASTPLVPLHDGPRSPSPAG